jgi:hypothetical protein
MSKIKDETIAKVGLNGLFGGVKLQPTRPTPEEGLTSTQETNLSTEELLDTLKDDETKQALLNEVKRRQYLKAGRPFKGEDRETGKYVRMTFLISPEKQERLREIALQEGLFIKEVLERGIDMVIAEYDNKEGK